MCSSLSFSCSLYFSSGWGNTLVRPWATQDITPDLVKKSKAEYTMWRMQAWNIHFFLIMLYLSPSSDWQVAKKEKNTNLEVLPKTAKLSSSYFVIVPFIHSSNNNHTYDNPHLHFESWAVNRLTLGFLTQSWPEQVMCPPKLLCTHPWVVSAWQRGACRLRQGTGKSIRQPAYNSTLGLAAEEVKTGW